MTAGELRSAINAAVSHDIGGRQTVLLAKLLACKRALELEDVGLEWVRTTKSNEQDSPASSSLWQISRLSTTSSELAAHRSPAWQTNANSIRDGSLVMSDLFGPLDAELQSVRLMGRRMGC